MAKISWIHFSDLHLNKTGTETKRLRKNLIDYLQKMNKKFDYAFFTGNIRYAPDGNFPDNAGYIIETICSAINLPEKHLFIVPGNHDIDRNCDDKNEVIQKLSNGDNKYKSGIGIIPETDIILLNKAKTDFYKFVESIDQKWIYKEQINNPKEMHYLIKTDELNIIHIDSTMFYTEQRQRDFIIGTYRIMELLDQVDNDKMTVVISHYSFDFIEENERRELIALFGDYHVDIWMAGHEHNHLVRKQYDTFYEFQTGNLLLEEGAKTCFLVGEVDTLTRSGVVESHAWFPQGGWAMYPFLSYDEKDRAKYYFNYKNISYNSNNDSIKESIRCRVHDLLEMNKKMFEVYGPSENNMGDITSEKAELWESIIKSEIIPNSDKIIKILSENHDLLTERDKKIFVEYKAHINGFKKNHEGNGHIFDAPRFPNEMDTILY